MSKNIYRVKKIKYDPLGFTGNKSWQNIDPVEIKHYMWMNNGYAPKVFAKVFYSNNFIYVFFKVYEKKIRIQYTQCGDPVYKDSCVEFFINPFPKSTHQYFNIEINAVGAILVGFGDSDRDEKRYFFNKHELKGFNIITSVKKPVSGFYGADNWTVHYRFPIKFIEKCYKRTFNAEPAIGNFYKCGDETEFEHYGAWNPILNKTPNFHMPQYFGIIEFEK